MEFKVGDRVYFTWGYGEIKVVGTVLKVNKKTLVVKADYYVCKGSKERSRPTSNSVGARWDKSRCLPICKTVLDEINWSQEE